MLIKSVTFNIRCFSDPDGHSISERAPRLHKAISHYDPDVICLQEFRPWWKKYITKYFGGKYNMFNKYRSKFIDVESSPILWKKDKFNCLRAGWFWLSDTPERESRGWDELYNCFRMCAYVVLEDKTLKKPFVVMNTHFGFGDNGQIKSAKLIKEYSLNISDYPTFVMGDFNMTPDSLGYKTMCQGFVDLNTATAQDLRSTFHGYTPKEILDQHIDYCFINNKITPLSRTLIETTFNGKFPSDHYGIFVTMEV